MPQTYTTQDAQSPIPPSEPRVKGGGTLACERETAPPNQADLFTHLSAIVRASEDAVISATLDGTIVVWNPCAEAVFGYSAAEAIGRPLSLLMPPDRPGELETVLARIRRGEHVDKFEAVRVHKDGSRVDVSVSAFAVRDASGAVVGVSAIARDITESKRVERELQRWRNQFQAIGQGVDDAIVVRAPGGGIVYTNEKGARLLGFKSVEELMSVPTGEIISRYSFYTQSGDPLPPEESPGLLALRGIEVPPTVLRYRLNRTGEERWAEVTAVPIRDEAGEVRYAASILKDISEHKRIEQALRASEARFQAFMDNSPIVAFIKDEQARFVYVNPQFERLFQTTAASVMGVSDTELVPDSVARRMHEDDAAVLATGELKRIVEVIPAPDGTSHHWLTFKFPIYLPASGQGVQRFVAGASVEITDRVRAEEELHRHAERLRALSRQLIEAQEAERRRISRDLHDQIGQSLTAIKIDLQMAQHQAASASVQTSGRSPVEPREEFIERLGKTVEMVERTIQQVREFSLDLRPSILDDLGLPSALLWYAEEQARRASFTTRLAIEQFPVRLRPELEITLFRVAQEAITNVVRHANAGRVTVELRRSGDSIVLTVGDDGAGFDAGALDSGPPGDRGGEGTGPRHARGADRIRSLGLAGMNERVLLVGGSLSIESSESSPGAGTVVRAVFPLDPLAGHAREGT